MATNPGTAMLTTASALALLCAFAIAVVAGQTTTALTPDPFPVTALGTATGMASDVMVVDLEPIIRTLSSGVNNKADDEFRLVSITPAAGSLTIEVDPDDGGGNVAYINPGDIALGNDKLRMVLDSTAFDQCVTNVGVVGGCGVVSLVFDNQEGDVAPFLAYDIEISYYISTRALLPSVNIIRTYGTNTVTYALSSIARETTPPGDLNTDDDEFIFILAAGSGVPSVTRLSDSSAFDTIGDVVTGDDSLVFSFPPAEYALCSASPGFTCGIVSVEFDNKAGDALDGNLFSPYTFTLLNYDFIVADSIQRDVEVTNNEALTLAASGGDGVFTFSIESAVLPPGVVLLDGGATIDTGALPYTMVNGLVVTVDVSSAAPALAHDDTVIFSYQVTDSVGNVSPSPGVVQVTYYVRGVATGLTFDVNVQSTLVIDLSTMFVSPEDPPYIYKINDVPAEGTLHDGGTEFAPTIAAGVYVTASEIVTYNPDATAGSVGFTLVVADDNGDSSPTTVMINKLAIPESVPASRNLEIGASTAITLGSVGGVAPLSFFVDGVPVVVSGMTTVGAFLSDGTSLGDTDEIENGLLFVDSFVVASHRDVMTLDYFIIDSAAVPITGPSSTVTVTLFERPVVTSASAKVEKGTAGLICNLVVTADGSQVDQVVILQVPTGGTLHDGIDASGDVILAAPFYPTTNQVFFVPNAVAGTSTILFNGYDLPFFAQASGAAGQFVITKFTRAIACPTCQAIQVGTGKEIVIELSSSETEGALHYILATAPDNGITTDPVITGTLTGVVQVGVGMGTVSNGENLVFYGDLAAYDPSMYLDNQGAAASHHPTKVYYTAPVAVTSVEFFFAVQDINSASIINRHIINVVDDSAAVVQAVTLSPTTMDASPFGLGEEVIVQVRFTKLLFFEGDDVVDGPPTIFLELERIQGDAVSVGVATYTDRIFDSLFFTYTVADDDTNLDLDYLATVSLVNPVGGRELKGVVGTQTPLAELDLPVPMAIGSLSNNEEIVIDGIRPFIVSIEYITSPGTYGQTQVIEIVVTWSEDIFADNAAVAQIELSSTGQALFTGTSGNEMYFSYTVGSGENTTPANLDYVDANSFDLNGMIVVDHAGNEPTDVLLPAPGVGTGSLEDSAAIVINTEAPVIISVQSAPGSPDGTYVVGQSVVVTVLFSKEVKVTLGDQIPTLEMAVAVNDGVELITWSSGDGTDTLGFQFNVRLGMNSGQLDYSNEFALDVGDSTIQDLFGNPAVLALPAPPSTYHPYEDSMDGNANCLGQTRNIVIDTQPILNLVTIASDNVDNPMRATVGSVVTITFHAVEPISEPEVFRYPTADQINPVDVVPVDPSFAWEWSATWTVADGDPEQQIEFIIGPFNDLGINAFTSNPPSLTVTSDGSFVIIDTTPPVLVGIPADLDEIACFDIPEAADVTAVDDVDGEVPVFLTEVQDPPTTEVCLNNYVITRTWTATDESGNTVFGNQTIGVRGFVSFCAHFEDGKVGDIDDEFGSERCACNDGYYTSDATFPLCDVKGNELCQVEDDDRTIEAEISYSGSRVLFDFLSAISAGSSVRRIVVGRSHPLCQFPGVNFEKDVFSPTCSDVHRGSIDSSTLALCDIIPFASDLSPASLLAAGLDPTVISVGSKAKARDEFDTVEWWVYVIDIQIFQTDPLPPFALSTIPQTLTTIANLRAVLAYPKDILVDVGELLVTSSHGLETIVVDRRWEVRDPPADPSAAVLVVATIVRFPYRITEIDMSSAPEGLTIVADIAADPTANPSACSNDIESSCEQRFVISLIPDRICTVDGNYIFDVWFDCRDGGAACTTDSDSFEIRGLNSADVCSLTLLDESNTISSSLVSYGDNTFTTPKTAYFLGEYIFFEGFVSSTSYPIKDAEMIYLQVYHETESSAGGAINWFVESLPALSDDSFRASAYMTSVEFPELAQGDAARYVMIVGVRVEYEDGSSNRRSIGMHLREGEVDEAQVGTQLTVQVSNDGRSQDGNAGLGPGADLDDGTTDQGAGTGGNATVAVAVGVGLVAVLGVALVVGGYYLKQRRTEGEPGTQFDLEAKLAASDETLSSQSSSTSSISSSSVAGLVDGAPNDAAATRSSLSQGGSSFSVGGMSDFGLSSHQSTATRSTTVSTTSALSSSSTASSTSSTTTSTGSTSS